MKLKKSEFNKKVLNEISKEKDRKIAKTFSISQSNYDQLVEWCESNEEKPSNVIDKLLKVFFE